MFHTGEKLYEIKSMLLLDYANYLMEKKDVENAIKYYNKSINLNPDNFYAFWGLASVFLKKKLHREALEYCNKALSIKPYVQLFILQSIIYKSLGESLKSDNALKKTLNYFNDDLAAAYDQFAHTYCFYEMYDEAEYYLLEAIKVNPNEAGLHYNLALVYSAKGQYQMAIDEFEKVLTLPIKKIHHKYKEYAQKEIKKITPRVNPIVS
jgi:tetratricopeptide (TPR) repeat protein